MKKLLYILFLLSGFLIIVPSCTKSQSSGYLGRNVTPASQPHSLIIFNGESNSGGYADNTDALPGELGLRSNVKIFNDSTYVLETLNIGANNILCHNGFGYNIEISRHGWELGLANSVDSGTLPAPLNVVKTGQGGSLSANWAPSGPPVICSGRSYYNEMVYRIDSAKKLVTAINGGVAPQLYMFYSLGINDAIANTDTTTWHVAVKTFFAAVRSAYGTVPIFMTKIPTAYAKYNITIANICSEISDCYVIETSDLALQGDGNHWTYASMKTIATRMIYTLKAHYTYNDMRLAVLLIFLPTLLFGRKRFYESMKKAA